MATWPTTAAPRDGSRTSKVSTLSSGSTASAAAGSAAAAVPGATVGADETAVADSDSTGAADANVERVGGAAASTSTFSSEGEHPVAVASCVSASSGGCAAEAVTAGTGTTRGPFCFSASASGASGGVAATVAGCPVADSCCGRPSPSSFVDVGASGFPSAATAAGGGGSGDLEGWALVLAVAGVTDATGTDGAGAAAEGVGAGAGAGVGVAVFFREKKDVADASLPISPVPAAEGVSFSESPVMRPILPAPAYRVREKQRWTGSVH